MADDLNNTLLALQILNGVKMYAVRIAGTNTTYTYKSNRSFLPGTAVLVQTKNTFVAGIVDHLVEDFDYSMSAEWKWVLFEIENPEQLAENFAELDRSAKRKLMQAQAVKAAKDLLAAQGLTMTDLKALLGSMPEEAVVEPPASPTAE